MWYILIIAAAFLLTTVKVTAQECVAPWVKYMNTGDCVQMFEIKASFVDAEANCIQLGGHLVSIHNAFENAVVAQLGQGQPDSLIIGYRYDENTNLFSWTDGSVNDYAKLDAAFVKQAEFYGDCAKMAQKNAGIWTNVNCEEEPQPYVCQRKAQVPAGAQCPDPDTHYMERGTLLSPGYPGQYVAALGCSYLLAGKTGHKISITFEELQLSGQDDLEAYDGPTDVKPLACFNGNNPCTPQQPAVQKTFLSNSHEMLVKFNSNGAGRWKITWHQDPDEAPPATPAPSLTCPPQYHIYKDGEAIQSPGYPHNYGPNSDCIYLLQNTGIQNKITLHFTELGLLANDFIELYDNSASAAATPFATTKDGGVILDNPITAPSNEVRMFFHSGVNSYGRWNLKWDSTEDPTCSSLIYYDQGVLHSPGYPGNYGPNKKCIYFLENTDTQTRITVQFTELALHVNDYIELWDHSGVTVVAPFATTRYGGITVNNPVTAPSNNVEVIFHSDVSSFGRWSFNWDSTEGADCSSGTYYDHGEIKSPSYPSHYPALSDCRYLISVALGQKVYIHFREASLGNAADLIRIYDGGIEAGKYDDVVYGSQLGHTYYSKTNQVLLIFQSDSNEQPGERWYLEFSHVY